MSLRNLLASAALAAAALGAASSAMASPIPLLNGYSGPITIKFSDFEAFTGNGTLAVSNSNFGIVQITSILDANSNVIYSAPLTPSAATPLYVGLFSGIHVASVTTGQALANTAGNFSFYADTSSTFGTIAGLGLTGYTTGGCSSTNTQCYNGITNMGYDNILNFSLVPGATDTAPTAYLQTTITSTNPLVGAAQGYADITGGSDAGQFATGTQTTGAGTPADLFIQDDFCAAGNSYCLKLPGPTGEQFTLGSQDPVSGVTVPEPNSLALLGVGLVGMGAMLRRRRKKSARA